MNMTYKQAYVEAFTVVHPNVDVHITGPNKRGLHSVAINGDKGDIRLTESDLKEATRMLQSRGPASLSNHMEGTKTALKYIANYKE